MGHKLLAAQNWWMLHGLLGGVLFVDTSSAAPVYI
jgi:hypothetical protein